MGAEITGVIVIAFAITASLFIGITFIGIRKMHKN
jgi:hypothetical protein